MSGVGRAERTGFARLDRRLNYSAMAANVQRRWAGFSYPSLSLMLAATDAVQASIYIAAMSGAMAYYGARDEPHSRPHHAMCRITDVCTVHHGVRRLRSQHSDPSD